MADTRSDPTFVTQALTREQYMEKVAELGRPLNWTRCWYRRLDTKQDNAKYESRPMERFNT